MQVYPVIEEVRQHWAELLQRVDRPSARQLIDRIDLSHPLGLKPGSSGKVQTYLLIVLQMGVSMKLTVRLQITTADCSVHRQPPLNTASALSWLWGQRACLFRTYFSGLLHRVQSLIFQAGCGHHAEKRSVDRCTSDILSTTVNATIIMYYKSWRLMKFE